MVKSNGGLPPVVSIRGLTKRFGNLTAVDRLDLEVMPGEVFGFLGPNGAGKTTTIGMLLGLVRPTAGSVEVFGLDARQHRGEILRRLGAIVETPAFYPYLSGRDNLRAVAKYGGGRYESGVDAVLELVGLGDRKQDKVKHYSTGMKQRLGLASVLLGEPELVVLDEPTAGLDPAGTHQFREIIRAIADDRGHTVFMSSHLLSEVQQTCDRVAIIAKGRTLVQGPLEELLRRTGGVFYEVDKPEEAIKVLAAAGVKAGVDGEDGTVRAEAGREQAGELNAMLVGAGIMVSASGVRGSNLESVFLEITGDDDAEPGTGD
jgi:ABC-2 type transport system ATP-binding protein